VGGVVFSSAFPLETCSRALLAIVAGGASFCCVTSVTVSGLDILWHGCYGGNNIQKGAQAMTTDTTTTNEKDTKAFYDHIREDMAQFSPELVEQMRGIIARGIAQRTGAESILNHLAVLLGPIVCKVWGQAHDEAVTAYREIAGVSAANPKTK